MFSRQALNRLILLRLFSLVDSIHGITRIQNIVYSAEEQGRKEKINIFNYEFISWHYGAYSEELDNDLELLVSQKIIEKNEDIYTISKTAKKALDKFKDIFSTLKVDKILKKVSKQYTSMESRKLLENSLKVKDLKGDILLPLIDENEIGELIHV